VVAFSHVVYSADIPKIPKENVYRQKNSQYKMDEDETHKNDA